MTAQSGKPIRFGDLGVRVASGVVLTWLVMVDLWMGGHWIAVLAAVACVLMLWELHRMITGVSGLAAPPLLVLALSGGLAVLATEWLGFPYALGILALGAVAMAALARPWFIWLAGGLVYIGVAMCFLIVLRDDPAHGLLRVLWLILVVVAADVGAYFVGRLLGGPRLWPAVSPGKTWSGALGGLAFAVVAGLGFAVFVEQDLLLSAFLSLGAGIASQFGDLLESAIKRHCGIKDASRLIPGHGGVMDRLDGLLGALWFFALYQGLRTGFGA